MVEITEAAKQKATEPEATKPEASKPKAAEPESHCWLHIKVTGEWTGGYKASFHQNKLVGRKEGIRK